MLKNYLKIGLRNIARHKSFAVINILGLAIGMACALLIMMWVFDELSYDSFNKNADRIYRINTDLKFGATELAIPVCSDMMGPIIKNDYPQVEDYTRIYTYRRKLIKKGNEFFIENKVAYVDSTFFRVFTFEFVSGNTGPHNIILNEPNTIVITESAAKKYLGTADAVGRTITTDDSGNNVYKVTGVIKDMPENSHFRFDFLFPMQNLNYDWGNFVSSNFHTYLLLRKGVNYKEFDKNLVDYNIKYSFPYAKKYLQIQSYEDFVRAGNRLSNTLIPLTEIHLYSKRAQEISPTGTIQYVYIFSAAALFILLIACVNFMNLTTAHSANRAREVGIRKVLGTERKNLISQFLTESVLMSIIAALLAVIIVLFVLPYFSDLAGKNLTIKNLFSGPVITFLILLPFIIGIIAGSYPAFFLSRFMPSEIIKGKFSKGIKSGGLRSTLVVFQFVASIILITGTIIIYNQLNFIRQKDLGYQKDQILIINNAYVLGSNLDAFKNEMLNVSGVNSGTISGFLPIPSQRNFSAFTSNPSSVEKGGITMQRWDIDYDYLKTLGIKIIKGRNFSEDYGTDTSAVILNEKAVKQLGLTNALNQKLYTWVGGGRFVSYNIIGVVKDFNFESLHQDIGPLALILRRSTGLCSFKISAANVQNILSEAAINWRKFSPGLAFSYSFLDDSFNDLYKTDRRIGVIALLFSGLAIMIACLGLFGLAAFMAEQKTKEIGIRKALGATVPSILFMLSKEFLKWIIIANIIALPIAYYFMNKWLQEFAYRIDMGWWIFVLAGGVALVIALVTVSFQAVKAAVANPIDSLRYE